MSFNAYKCLSTLSFIQSFFVFVIPLHIFFICFSFFLRFIFVFLFNLYSFISIFFPSLFIYLFRSCFAFRRFIFLNLFSFHSECIFPISFPKQNCSSVCHFFFLFFFICKCFGFLASSFFKKSRMQFYTFMLISFDIVYSCNFTQQCFNSNLFRNINLCEKLALLFVFTHG